MLPITCVVLYKHGVGYFEREGEVENDAVLTLSFKQSEVSDILKSLTVLDLDGGHVTAVSYDSTKPVSQLLSEIAIAIPDAGSLAALVPQLKGARANVQLGNDSFEGMLLGIDVAEETTAQGTAKVVQGSLLSDSGEVRTFPLLDSKLRLVDDAMRGDLEFYLRAQLSSKKKDARTFTLFAEGQGKRRVRLSYVLEAPVWKATYRILLNDAPEPSLIQGWAVVDNTQDEDWNGVSLSLIAGLPVSFVHDLYTPRYIRRPVVAVRETTGVLPPEVEIGAMGQIVADLDDADQKKFDTLAYSPVAAERMMKKTISRELHSGGSSPRARSGPSSVQTQVRERQVGDLFEYEIERPVTIRRNQSALVPIVLKPFKGKSVLMYQKAARAENPMRCVEFENSTGLTLEGGPVTVLEDGSYVGEAMLETMKPMEQRLVPYAVELSVRVMDSIDSHQEDVKRIVVRKGTLNAHCAQVQVTTYTLINNANRDYVVYLDHPRGASDSKLDDTPAPHETTDNFWRFRFNLPPSKTLKFIVRQQRPLKTTQALADFTERQLGLWIEQKYLDKKTAAALKEAVSLRHDAAACDERFGQLQSERDRIHAEQKRIRENLNSLGDRPSEKELRERFVRTFNAQEDRLEAIEKESKKVLEERDNYRAKIDEMLAKLEYESVAR